MDETQAEAAVEVLDRLMFGRRGEQEEDGPTTPSDTEDWITQGRPFTFDSPFRSIIGMADSGPDGPTDVSRNRHKYLADAYADLHEE